MNILKSIFSVSSPKPRSLGFCMVFASSDRCRESYFKLGVEKEELQKFKVLPQDMEPMAFMLSVDDDYSYKNILMYIQNSKLSIYIECRNDSKNQVNYVNSPLKEIDITQYMNNELISFCRKLELNFELHQNLNHCVSQRLKKI